MELGSLYSDKLLQNAVVAKSAVQFGESGSFSVLKEADDILESSVGREVALEKVREKQQEKYRSEIGYDEDFEILTKKPNDEQERFRQDVEILKRRGFGDEKYSFLKTSKELEEEAVEYGKQIARDRDYIQNTYDLPLTEFGASAWSATTDPINLITMPLGGGVSVAKNLGYVIAKTAAKEAGISAGAELAIMGSVADWREELGMEYGFDDVARNVGFAALFGGAFGGAIAGAKPAFRAAKEGANLLTESVRPTFSRVVDTLADRLPKNTADNIRNSSLLKVFARQESVLESAPTVGRNDSLTINAHSRAVKEGQDSILNNRRVDQEKLVSDATLYSTVKELREAKDLPYSQALKLKEMEKVLPDGEIIQPSYTKETLPQQVVQKLDKSTSLKPTDLTPQERAMLKSADVKLRKDGSYSKVGIKQLINKRKQEGNWEGGKLDKTAHIKDFDSKVTIRKPDIKQIRESVGVKDIPMAKDPRARAILDEAYDEVMAELGLKPASKKTPKQLKADATPMKQVDELALLEAEFDEIINSELGLEIEVDGVAMGGREAKELFETEGRILSEIMSCGLGRKK